MPYSKTRQVKTRLGVPRRDCERGTHTGVTQTRVPRSGIPRRGVPDWDGFKTILSLYVIFHSHDSKPGKDFLFKTPKARAHGLKPSL